MNRLQVSLFLRFIPGVGNILAKRLWEFSNKPESIFEQSYLDLQTIEGIGTVHLQYLKSWKKYTDIVYRVEENLEKIIFKPFFWGIPITPKPLLFVRMPLWFYFIKETSILISVRSLV